VIYVHARTSFAHEGLLVFDRQGTELFVIVVKATYRLRADGSLDQDTEQQLPVFHSDQFWGEPGLSSIRYEADIAWHKAGVDLVVNGRAYSRSRSTHMLVELATRYFRKRLLVSGDRFWEAGAFGIRATPPQQFDGMPIVYERAFGGIDLRDTPHAQTTNPIGTGFCFADPPKSGTPLPNIEDPARPIEQWQDRPHVMGFGFVGRGWQPRVQYAGTYDETWQSERFPLLPADFDERHFLASPADQVLPPLTSPEPLLLRGLTRDRDVLQVEVPPLRVPVYARRERDAVSLTAELDTIIIEPDEARMILTCRVAIEVGYKIGRLREVMVGPASRGQQRAFLARKRYVNTSAHQSDERNER
jgi:hypothetical protein